MIGIRAIAIIASLAAAGAAPAAPHGDIPARVAVERWAEAGVAVREAPWQQWLERESDALRRWMAAPRDDPGWVAGWAHDLVDPRTGAFLGWNPGMACSRFGEPGSRPFRACVALQRQHDIAMTLSAARIARLSGDAGLAAWAAAQLDRYQAIHASRGSEGSGRSGRLFPQLLDEATVLTSLADARRLLREQVPAARAERWCSELLLPMGRAMLEARGEVHNIAVWYGVGASIAAMECGDAPMLEAAVHGQAGLLAALKTGLSEDGFWFELSPQYQSYVATALSELLIAASLRGEAGRFDAVWPDLGRLLLAPAAVAFGGGDGPTINDMNRHVPVPDPALAARARRVVPTDAGVAEANRSPGWGELLDPADGEGAIAYPLFNADTEASRWVAGLKSLYLKKNGWVGLLRAGQGARFHAHQDALSVELKFGDAWVFRNSVTPAYGSALHASFFRRAAAHGVPLVDGRGGSNWFKAPTRVRADDRGVSAEFTSYGKEVTASRALSVDDGQRFTDLATFRVSGPAPRAVGVLYHSDCGLATPAPAAQADPLLPPVELSPQLTGWKLMHSGSGHWDSGMRCGEQEFALAISGSRPLRVWRGESPALSPPRRRMALFVELERGGSGWISASLLPVGPQR